MLQKTDNKLTENERLSTSTHSFGCYFNSPILFVLSFVLCLFLSFSVASADSLSPVASVFSNDISDYNINISDSAFNSAVGTINAWSNNVLYPYSSFTRIYSNNKILYCITTDGRVSMFRSSSSGNASFSIDYSYNTSNFYRFSSLVSYNNIIVNNNNDKVICYIYCLDLTNHSFGRIGSTAINSSAPSNYSTMFNVLENNSVNNFFYYYEQWSWNLVQDASSGLVTIPFSSVSSNVSVYGSGQLFGSFSDSTKWFISDNWFDHFPQYASDDRLKLYSTQSASHGSLLHVDLSEFYQYNNGVSSNYSFSDVVLTLDCDGTEHSFTLTPSGSQYEFLDSSTSSSRVYGYIVPYSFFSVSEYQNCSVVKVDFSRTISSPGGSGTEDFKISCSYPLKVTNINGNAQDFAPVTLAPVPSVTVAPDQSTVQDWSDNTSYKSPAFGHNGSYVLLNSLPIFPDWVDKYTLDCTRVNKTVDGITLNLWIDLDNPYVSVNTALVDIPITAFFTPESYLKDNVLTDFYDVVVFKVWSDTGKTSVDGYLYFYTEKYDLKYQNNLVVQELSLEYDSLNLLSSGFSLIRTGLDNIDNNTAVYFTDSLFNDTIVISWLQTLNNTNAFGFTDVVNAIEGIPQYDDSSVISGIASVVSAIEGIDSPDLSDLESKLDTLINFFVADGSTENASSRTYRNWLRGVDDNTSRTVTYYADNVFSIVHDVFDLFDADGSVYYPPDSEDVVSTDYINFVKLFIEKMNSSTATNTGYNKYLRGFFQGGFDPHLIDGGL